MATVELGENADVVEFCPNQPYLNIMAAASYTLQEGGCQGEASRLGGLYLYSADQNVDHHNSTSTLGLTQLCHHEIRGVFDIKWRPLHGGPPCLAEASSDGSVRLHSLADETLQLQEKGSADVSPAMCLYVDWNPIDSCPQISVSISDGSISIVDLGQSEPEVCASWQAHNYEAWVVSYDLWKPQIVFSGGDDCQFCCWDLRDSLHSPVVRDKKTHKMGVCSIQSNPLCENILITGSYDENVRLWDLRLMQKPVMKAELGLGGGVWRLKWHPSFKDIILAACMHNGAIIARTGSGEIEILEHYEEHKSLTYGASWYRGEIESDAEENLRGRRSLVATCSFYDKALHLWLSKTLYP